MNCKPGDRAIVIKSRTKSNIGRIVEVLRAYSPLDSGVIPTDGTRQMWLAKSIGSSLMWERAYSIGTEQRSEGPIPDECLWPIKDADDEHAVHDELSLSEDGQNCRVVYAQQTECCTAN